MVKTLTDFNRRDVDFRGAKVREVLPEYFQQDYPSIVTFMEKYYEFHDSSIDHNFTPVINSLLSARDIEDTSLANLDMMLKEIGIGTASTSFFRDPRSVSRLLAKFYRVKGSTYSADGFFKAFFNTIVDISYPKNNIFVVSNSKIGAEDLSFIQDGGLYQTYSILVKSEVPKTTWEDLFKIFVHPAGFFLGSEVQITTAFDMDLDDQPIAREAVDIPAYVSTAYVDAGVIQDVTELLPADIAGEYFRASVVDNIANYATFTVDQLNTMYPDTLTLMNITSPTMDDSAYMDMSNTIETMDQVKYEWYDSE